MAGAGPGETGATRVLLVDDEATLREPLADYLSRQGFEVVQAADGECPSDPLSRLNGRRNPGAACGPQAAHASSHAIAIAIDITARAAPSTSRAG